MDTKITDLLPPGERLLVDEINASMSAAAMLSAVLRPETMFSPPPTTETLAELAQALSDHYAGGDDGPIRDPGDDAPKDSDVYSDEDLLAALERHRNSAARMSRYDMAADLRMVYDRLEALLGLEADLERMNKQVQQLAAEKRQAQDWIANLRQTNELYAQRIAEQNAKLAEFGR